MPRRAKRTGYLPELRIAERNVGRGKPRRVGEIEEFAAHLQLHALADGKLLAEGEVRIVDSVAAQIGN